MEFKLTSDLRTILTANHPTVPSGVLMGSVSEAIPFPKPKLYLLIDAEMPCGWLVLYGWHIHGKLLGDVVYRGPDHSRFENEPKRLTDQVGTSYLTGLSRRMYMELV